MTEKDQRGIDDTMIRVANSQQTVQRSSSILGAARIHSISKVGCFQLGVNLIYLIVDGILLLTDFWRSMWGARGVQNLTRYLVMNPSTRHPLPRRFLNTRQFSRKSLHPKLELQTQRHPVIQLVTRRKKKKLRA